ncbi:MAG: hypothetical protein CSA83_00945 [Actinomycetales bacterium]|nr:MAG: hypothetical protein CSA83_00945 [Actinomycetales bacterium]
MLSVGTSLLRSTVVIVIGGILGASLAFILRRTSAVVGAILGYAFISPVINGQLSGAGYTEVLSFLPDNNLMALIEGQKIIYGWPQWEDGKETRATEIVISASQASIYWLILLVVIVGIAWYTFKRRDLV